MGLRAWLLGESERARRPPDPEANVLLAQIDLWRSNVVVAYLWDAGVPAYSVENSVMNMRTLRPTCRIFVQAKDLAAARQVLAELDAAPAAELPDDELDTP